MPYIILGWKTNSKYYLERWMLLFGILFFVIIAAVPARAQFDLDFETRELRIFEDPVDTVGEAEGTAVSLFAKSESGVPRVPERNLKLTARSPYTYTTNAFLSDDNEDGDHILAPSFGLLYEQTFENDFKLSIGPNIAFARYSDNTELNFDRPGGDIRLEKKWSGFAGQVSYEPRAVFSDGFDEHIVTLHRLRARVTPKAIPIPVSEDNCTSGGIAGLPCSYLTLRVDILRTFADPNDTSNTLGSLIAAFSHKFEEEDVTLSLIPSVSGVIYDDFPGESRRDLSLAVEGGLSWEPLESVTVSGAISYSKRYSTRGANQYDGFDITPRIEVSIALPIN